MLLISRKIGESVYLFLEDGTPINIRLLNFKKTKNSIDAIIGIDAPRSIRIMRDELVRRDFLNCDETDIQE